MSAEFLIRDMDEKTAYFVGTCSHTRESDEVDASAKRRIEWLTREYPSGVRAKVAIQVDADGEQPVGFVYVLPIERSPWGPQGADLMVLPCVWVPPAHQGRGAGKALVRAAEVETLAQGKKALAVIAYFHNFWFMPAQYFERLGYALVKQKKQMGVLWKVFNPSAKPPAFFERRFGFAPAPGKVAIDLFFNTFCATSDIEAARVREVAGEYGDRVVLREHNACDRDELAHTGIGRGIFVNGHEISWGYQAPKDGLRSEIEKALSAVQG